MQQPRSSLMPDKSFIDSLPMAIYGCDEDGAITYYNDRAAVLWGRLPSNDDRFCGTFRRFLLDGTELTSEETPMAIALRTGRRFSGQQAVVERPDGSRIVCEVNITPVFDGTGSIIGAINVFKDLSVEFELKERLADAERHTEKMFEMIAEAMPHKVWTSAPDGRLVFMNSNLMEYTGLSLEIGDIFSLARAIVHPADFAEVARLQRQERDAGTPFELTVRWRDLAGNYRWHLVRSILPSAPGGGFGPRIVTATDVHDLMLAKERFERVKQQAEAANRAKNTFLMNMSHEMRTPLTAILGFTELMKEDDLSADERLNFIRRVENSGAQLLSLINDVLDLSKVEAGRLTIDMEWVNLAAIVGEAVELLRVQAARKGLELRVDVVNVAGERLLVDPRRFRQILMNLVDNAIKFTKAGSVDVRATIAVRASGEREARVEVIDTGIGIGRADQTLLFQPFLQFEGKLSREAGGTGIGLALANRLARLLGGEIELVSSEVSGPRTGSTFCLRMPLRPSVEAAGGGRTQATAPSKKSANVLAGMRVLLADDILENRLLFCRILEKAGALVEVAQDGVEAVALAEQAAFDIVLMDLQMPRMDGVEAAERIRAMGFARPIVAITAHVKESKWQRSAGSAFDGVLTKPISRQQLIDAVLRYCPTGTAPSAHSADE